ncbi:magnesium transporter MgtE N-terminal domain-containing protein [Anaerocolumna sp. MB42-C2]|uniref:magnesium transporter MgtE N-terminal domain-containing protein n=1 Tax=Anaerocolumna sp. MB42-C2 TaxID=3070997 RepID=UPI0027DF5365|nr:CBS domain-containing protein [Anaerocolumna sp. MB42-C2]WMJ86780.1 CBS domain-containing protein [Anaerocolumna sp. MB42-C2]
MQKSNNFFFSKILYKSIYNIQNSIIGKLNDVILDFNASKPMIKAIEVKIGGRLSYISADFLEVYNDGEEKYSVKMNTSSINVMPYPENEFFLAKDFLDKQIVDINGRKVERVNDVRVGIIQGKWCVVAVDIGLRGLLRRLGFEYSAIRISHIIKKEFRNTLVYWDNVQPLSTGIPNLQLSTSMNKLTTLHAADIADIIEELDKQSQITLFHVLDNAKAAEVLEEMETESQLNIIDTLPDEKASDILEIMPSDEAADILEEIEDTRVEKLLEQMQTENSSEIRELMEYDEKTVGSVMTKDFISFLPDITVEKALAYIKTNQHPKEFSHNIYLANNNNKLIGVVTLFDIIVSEADNKLYDLMNANFKRAQDEDKIENVMEIMQKYNLHEIPVVDENNDLVGIVSLNDILNEYIRLRRIPA